MTSLLDLRDRLPEPYRSLIKRTARAALAILPTSNLELLAFRHGTDKWQQGYMPFYQRHFRPIRRKCWAVLEIGIGTTGPRGGGDSLRMWKEYFPAAKIYGVDILDKKIHEDTRIRVFQGSQNDPDFLREVARLIGHIDVIIDDGSHVNEHVITSFRTLFPLLADGGIYVIEDMVTSYYPKFGGDSRNLRNPGTTVNLVKELCDNVNSALIPGSTRSDFDAVAAVHVYQGIAFITKNARKRPYTPSPFLGDP